MPFVDQGAGCVADLIDDCKKSGQPIPAQMKTLIEGVDLEAEDYGLEILKRTLRTDKRMRLWWD